MLGFDLQGRLVDVEWLVGLAQYRWTLVIGIIDMGVADFSLLIDNVSHTTIFPKHTLCRWLMLVDTFSQELGSFQFRLNSQHALGRSIAIWWFGSLLLLLDDR